MLPKKGATKKAPGKKPPPKKGGRQNSTSGSDASSHSGKDGSKALPSPTDSVGLTWDSPLRRLPDAVKATVDNGPLPGLNNTPIPFNNPGNYCYRNAMMTMLMYTPQLLGYVQRWHMQIEFPGHQYQDHILQALDTVAQTYHSTVPTRVRDTEAAMLNLWQLFRGTPSSVFPFEGALPEPEDAEQEDSSELLLLMLSEIETQLRNGWIPDAEDETQSVFQAMLKTSVTVRTRCPGTQDGLCTDPNRKQRRQLDESHIFKVRISTGKDLTLRDCIADTMRDRDQRWCDECFARMRHTNTDTKNRDDRAWRNIRECPEVFFMQLQRFQQVQTAKGLRDEKVTAPVAIPETLDLSDFLEYHSYGEGSVVQYELRAVVSHIGRLGSGHYVAHVKEGQNWWRVDDLGKSKNVTPSSIEKINVDGGGRSGTGAKGKSHPFLLSWVKVKEDIVAPTRAPVKTSTIPPSEGGKGPEKSPKAGDGNGAEGEEEEGTEIPGGKGPKNGSREGEPPKSPARQTPPDDDDDAEPPAAEGKCKIWVILNLGDEEVTIAFKKTKANVSLDCSKDFPFSGDVRIVDDQGNLFSWDFANEQGIAQHEAVKTGSPKVPRKPKTGTGSAPAPKNTARIKRKEPEPEDETYVDPTDSTYMAPGKAKKPKTEPKGLALKAVIDNPPRPVRRGGRLVRGPKPGKPVSSDEDEERPVKGGRRGKGRK